MKQVCIAITAGFLATLLLVGVWAPAAAAGEEPPPPEGLGSAEPDLPVGLAAEPQMPEGLSGEEPGTRQTSAETSVQAMTLTGFWEARGGLRLRDDRYEKEDSVGETRLQLETEKVIDQLTFKLTSDFLYDWTLDRSNIDLETGHGWIDLREASVAFTPFDFMDIKVGRQILTWGTGDLLFLNDLFPKDWQAFFIGRDVEYLKAPSDAIKTSLYFEPADVDIVYVPKFDSDRFIRGERLSYYNGMAGSLAGRNAIVSTDRPNDVFKDDEWALRVSKNVNGRELALYGYSGFWKSPAGMDPASGRATFPRLRAYGASGRTHVGHGIGNLEIAYYDSLDDRSGTNPFVDNSQLRFLAGYEQDLKSIARDLTVGAQWYLEWMQDYDDYRNVLPAGAKPSDEYRQVCTVRVTKLLANQNLNLSFFAFYSPDDQDAYLRPNVSYKFNDHWTGEVGGNIFIASDNRTFFGQFAHDTNVYVGLRCGF